MLIVRADEFATFSSRKVESDEVLQISFSVLSTVLYSYLCHKNICSHIIITIQKYICIIEVVPLLH